MTKNLFQKKFDPSVKYVARRAFGDYAMGETIVKKDFTPHRFKQLYSARMIVMKSVWDEFVGGVSPTPTKNAATSDPAPVVSGGVLPGVSDGAA